MTVHSAPSVVKINDCARCGGNHDCVRMQKFRRPAGIFSYWAECPITLEPIFIHIASIYQEQEPLSDEGL